MVNLVVEVSFLNDKAPTFYLRKPVFVIILAETSDGQLLNFCRIRYVSHGWHSSLNLRMGQRAEIGKGYSDFVCCMSKAPKAINLLLCHV